MSGRKAGSLPLRERGLKLKLRILVYIAILSLPLRERGLKSSKCAPHPTADRVAPLAGAWIEIVSQIFRSSAWIVAPLAGAWIEINTV